MSQISLLSKLHKLFIIVSLIALPIWVIYSKSATIATRPIKLYNFIHPFYYIGFILLLIAFLLKILFKIWNKAIIIHPFFTVLLLTIYIQLPALAIFQYPLNDHTHHLAPIYYIINNYNINWPDYLGHRETVAPQLFAAIFIIITDNYSVFTLHKISLIFLPILVIIYIYIIAKTLNLNTQQASLAALLALALMYTAYYFLRQTFTMPIYILVVLLILKAFDNKKYLIPLLILLSAFVFMDPAHVLLTILSLTIFPLIKVLNLLISTKSLGKMPKEIRLVSILTIMMLSMYIFWIIVRNPNQLIGLSSIANRIIETFLASLKEPEHSVSETMHYWGKPTALKYNSYYAILYKLKVITRGMSIILATLVALRILIRKNRINNSNSFLIISFFIVTAVVIALRGYGFTFAPWTALLCSLIFNKTINKRKVINMIAIFILLTVFVMSVFLMPHIVYVGGRIRLPEKDLYFLSWYVSYSIEKEKSYVFLVPGLGRWLSKFSYIEYGNYIPFIGYLFYEGLTNDALIRISHYANVVLIESALEHFEKTIYANESLSMFIQLYKILSKRHNLIYSSGIPFITAWCE